MEDSGWRMEDGANESSPSFILPSIPSLRVRQGETLRPNAPTLPTLSDPSRRSSAAGLAYGLAAYLAWGFIAIYFKQLKEIPPLTVLAHRILWSVAFLILLLIAQRQVGELFRRLRDPRALLVLFGSTVMIAFNWFTFIWAVSNGHLVEASFG